LVTEREDAIHRYKLYQILFGQDRYYEDLVKANYRSNTGCWAATILYFTIQNQVTDLMARDVCKFKHRAKKEQ